ncbi:ABC-three component system protein [uncultured Erythrobacter sp.]|uniref:ABC-three component system protein n=1 Tax=uncultured Erythrobacter sp. TaxID=263913 RepID=UPI00261A8535|nr:ABC-three component system protein [uncultured Erythrobacter sp.]
MIHDVTSDLASFKSLRFRPGLNVLLAEKSAGANDRQSRNGAGKTSFVELIHFLFGGNAKTDSIFRSDVLVDAAFEIRFDLGGHVVTAARSGSKPSRVLLQGETSHWPIPPAIDDDTGDLLLSNENWKTNLGALLFDLSVDPEARFAPTFRSLFSYFARRQGSGGFSKPTQQSGQQQGWDQQVAVSYLLGLDAGIAQEFQETRAQEKAMAELRKAAKQGNLGRFYGNAADFRTRLAVAQTNARRLQEQVAAFNVVPEYTGMEREATEITRAISALNNDNLIDRELIDQLKTSLEDETPPEVSNVERLYAEARVVLPGIVSRRFEDVARFHEAIIRNRRAHLTAEIEAAEARIVGRDRQRADLDHRRAQLMGILRSGGALEHYNRLQEEVGRAEANVEALRQQLDIAERIESTKVQLEIERGRLRQALQNDIHERDSVVREAILLFEELSNALYERAGSLTIDATPNGPSFEVTIDSQRSKGINSMQIFCFDLMLATLATRRGLGPGFLIHDSHLFDGVDERQVAKALQLGADQAEAEGLQYVVTMNSDAMPEDGFREGFDIRSFVNSTVLTDEVETGGLFGIHFD